MKIAYKEHKLEVELWRKALAGLADRLTAKMDALCYNQDFGLHVPDRIPDDWSNTARSYGWIDNADFVPDKLGLLHHMIKDESLRLASINSEGKLELKSAAMWDFLGRTADINRDLSLLCFFVNSQNTRISEFVEHKHRNSTRERTVFYDDFTHSIWMVTRRTKTKQETFIPLKCPPLVTDLLRKYLTIVRPVEEHFAYHLRGTEARTLYREYLWVQDCTLMQKQTMYNLVPDFLEDTINDRIGVHDYRQIAVEMSRCFFGSEFEMELEELDTLAAQRGHAEITAQRRYASEVGHLPGMPSELLVRFGRSSDKWHHLSGFKPGAAPLLPLKTRRDLLAKQMPRIATDSYAVDQAPFDIQEFITSSLLAMQEKMQTGLSKEIKSMLTESLPTIDRLDYQIQKMVNKAVGEAMTILPSHDMRISSPPISLSGPSSGFADEGSVPESEQIDESFHYPPIINVPPAIEIFDDRSRFDDIYEGFLAPQDPSGPMIMEPTAESQDVSTVATYDPSQETKDYLNHLLGQHFPGHPQPAFKSLHQMEAVELAVSRKENFVLVMPTGSGKSLVFTLPPFNEPTFRTYVIVPNRALLIDHATRCERLGLPTFQWLSKHKGVPDDTQIVFLALETATTQTFRK